MTNGTNRIEATFQDAREFQADALEMVAPGRIRDAAEKAWEAMKRATDALILARWPRRRRRQVPQTQSLVKERRPPSAPPCGNRR